MFLIDLVESTAADRAAADMRREGSILSRPSADSSFCGGSLWGGRVCGHDQRTEPVWRLCDRPLETFARSLLQLRGAQRWQVAAALSAAVTTTKQQETAPTLQAEPTQKNRPSRTPAALRERGSGGEALLSEKRPLPQNLPNASSFREGARGRGLFYQKSLLPRNHSRTLWRFYELF